MTDRETESTDLSPEVPPEDAFEQHLPAADADETEDEDIQEVPVETDPADLAEQSRTVILDDDEYR